MAITYQQLYNQILRATSKAGGSDPDFEASYPFIFNRAIERIYRDYPSNEKEKIEEFTFTTNNGEIDKPKDWESTVSICYGNTESWSQNTNFLTMQTPETLLASRSSVSGFPSFYSDAPFKGALNSKILINPIPSDEYKGRISYIALPPCINVSEDGQIQIGDINDNWVLVKYPSLIYYAALIESYGHFLLEEGIKISEKLYSNFLSSVSPLSKTRMVDKSSDRDSS